MPREVFTKVAADANGTWTRHTGDVTFATAGLTRGVLHDFSDGLTTVQVTPFGPPLAIAPGNISIANPEDGTGLEVTITTLPDNQGSAITDLEYEVDNSGTWVSWGSATTGTYLVPIAALTLDTEADIQVRARNASAAPGAELATPLTATPTNAGPTVFFQWDFSTDGDTGWSLASPWSYNSTDGRLEHIHDGVTSGAHANKTMPVAFTAGNSYNVTIDAFVSSTTGSMRFSTPGFTNSTYTNGVTSRVMVASDAQTILQFFGNIGRTYHINSILIEDLGAI